MGIYVETGTTHLKAACLIDEYGAEIIREDEALNLVLQGVGVVCIVDCGSHEAAGFAYDVKEVRRFMYDDGRSKIWVKMDRATLVRLTRYVEPLESLL